MIPQFQPEFYKHNADGICLMLRNLVVFCPSETLSNIASMPSYSISFPLMSSPLRLKLKNPDRCGWGR